jgi:hypothetical protein
MERVSAEPTSSARRAPSSARAWIALALTPIGVVAGVGAAYAVAGMIGVTLDPATPLQGRTFLQNALCYGTATVVALVAPVIAACFAVAPARDGNRAGRIAFVVAVLAALGVLALMVPSLVSW